MGSDGRLHGPGKSHHQNLGQMGAFTMTKRGGGTSIRSGSPARALVQVSQGGSGDEGGLGPGCSPSKCIPAGCTRKGKSCFQKPGPGRKEKKCSLPSGMWNFADDLLDFFPKPELPK